MLIDNDELKRRVGSDRNILNGLVSDNSIHRSAHPSVKRARIPTPLKVVAGVLARQEGTVAVAQELGISTATVSRAKNGRDSSVEEAVDEASSRIRDLALEKVMQSLGIIGKEKLSDCSAKDASIIAKNLAFVADKVSPQSKSPTTVQLVVYAPQQRDEKQYNTIDVHAG